MSHIPDSDGLYGRGFRDGLESLLLALAGAGAPAATLRDALTVALDAYGNHADQPAPQEIAEHLVLSAAHLSPKETAWLADDAALDGIEGIGVAMRGRFALSVWLDALEWVPERLAAWPGLQAAASLAVSCGATSLCFDGDGPMVEGLPVFEHESAHDREGAACLV